jgi:hypothetical protein
VGELGRKYVATTTMATRIYSKKKNMPRSGTSVALWNAPFCGLDLPRIHDEDGSIAKGWVV